MPSAFPEKRVLEMWQGPLQRRTDLVTAENEPIEIIYPGRLNDDRGADLRDAVVNTAQGRLKGDIEIHVKSSSWWTHRHHLDPVYNRVILHVVYWNDNVRPIVLENGFTVPTLALHDYIDRPAVKGMVDAIPSVPCRNAGHSRNVFKLNKILEAAGDERFLSNAAHLKAGIVEYGVGQALYRGIMTALGYAKNKEAMADLANRLPLERLEAAAAPGAPENECLAQYQARLIGTAGLLPSQREAAFPAGCPDEDWTKKLEKTWAGCREIPVMFAGDWRFFKVRPGNHPVRRLAAMSHLLLRYRKAGLLAGLRSIFESMGTGHPEKSLEPALQVNPDSFWGRYLDIGMPAGGMIPALLGKERAGEIVINVLLPFAAAGGFTDTDPETPGKALNIYREYRAAAENTLVKHMRKQLGVGKHSIDSARRQQGLLHIYKTRCSQGKCAECPLVE
jgi:hypothetical protein